MSSYPRRIVFVFFIVSVFSALDTLGQEVTPAIERQGRQSEISTNLYTCLDVFEEFSADCSANFWVLEFRWFPRSDNFRGDNSYSLFNSRFRSALPLVEDRAGGGRWGGGIALGVDTEDSTPPPAPPSSAFVDKDFRPQISSAGQAADTTFARHNGFYTAQLQAVLSLPSPFDPDLFNINVFGGAGFAWIKGDDPADGRPGIEGKKGIPTVSYGAEFLYNINRFSIRLQLNNTVYYPNGLNYIYDTPNGTSTIAQDVSSIRKLNLLFGFGYVILP